MLLFRQKVLVETYEFFWRNLWFWTWSDAASRNHLLLWRQIIREINLKQKKSNRLFSTWDIFSLRCERKKARLFSNWCFDLDLSGFGVYTFNLLYESVKLEEFGIQSKLIMAFLIFNLANEKEFHNVYIYMAHSKFRSC